MKNSTVVGMGAYSSVQRFAVGDEVKLRYPKHWMYFKYGIIIAFRASGEAVIQRPGSKVTDLFPTSWLLPADQSMK